MAEKIEQIQKEYEDVTGRIEDYRKRGIYSEEQAERTIFGLARFYERRSEKAAKKANVFC